MKKIITLSLLIILSISGVFAASGGLPESGGNPSPRPPVNSGKAPIQGLTILGDNYAVDAENVYVVNASRSGWIKITADRPTFRVILGQFARDKNIIFQMGAKIEGADLASFSVISGQHGYAQDNNHIYGPNGVMREADPETFKMLTKNYSVDSGHVFFEGKFVNDVDSGSFEVIDNGLYAIDDRLVLYAGKVLKDTSPDGFTVKGSRGFAADGRTFFEGLIERGDLNPGNPQTPTDPTDPTEPSQPTEIPDKTLQNSNTWKALNDTIAPYKAYFTEGNTGFWILVALSIVAIFSLLFVFFADRNDESAGFWKTLWKTLIAVSITLISIWITSYFLSPITALIVGVFIGVFFFVTLWSALGIIKSLLITILTLIGMVFIMALGFIILRMVFDDTRSMLDFITSFRIQLAGVMAMVGFFLGAFLIMTQLGSVASRSLGQAFIATLISLALLGLILWITAIGTFTSVVIFSLLYAILLWIMRFRMVSGLFAETVRIIRVAMIIAVVVGLVVWIVL